MNIFVFGSNLLGIHGAGAAKAARDVHGAIMGQGEGLQGQSYAIPTKRTPYESLPLEAIAAHVETFKDFARQHPDWTFQVTRIGCGRAGYTPADIAPFFRDAPLNCHLPTDFTTHLATSFEDLPISDRDLVLVTSEHYPDWYIVEWAEHDGREWIDKVAPGSFEFRRSARVSDADVEGRACEMRLLAQAIEAKTNVNFKRCAASTLPDGTVLLWSPRNSQVEARVSARAALTLVHSIHEVL